MVEGTNCKVLDTRKTTPGLRRLEKAAAAAGGVTNHRMGLYDAILIKNNHIAAAGGVRQAIGNARQSGLPIEIEVRAIDELHEALDAGADHLLLDNLSPQTAEEWIRIIAGVPRSNSREASISTGPELRRNRGGLHFRRSHHPLRTRERHRVPPESVMNSPPRDDCFDDGRCDMSRKAGCGARDRRSG